MWHINRQGEGVLFYAIMAQKKDLVDKLLNGEFLGVANFVRIVHIEIESVRIFV